MIKVGLIDSCFLIVNVEVYLFKLFLFDIFFEVVVYVFWLILFKIILCGFCVIDNDMYVYERFFRI